LLGNLELKAKCPINTGTAKIRVFLDPKAKKYVLESFRIPEKGYKKLKGRTVTIVIQ